MSRKTAPWINLTPDRPGLDAESRDTINEWCGVVGKQERYRRHHKRNIQFPSRAVNWKNQKPPKHGFVKEEILSKDVDSDEFKSKPTSARLSNSNNRKAVEATVVAHPTKAATKSKVLAQKKKRSPSIKIETDLDEKDQSSQQTPTIMWRDGSMGVRVDPFDSVPGTTEDPRQGEILDYYMQILDPGVVATFFVFDMRSTYGSMPLECLIDEEFRPLGLASIAGTMSSVRHAAVNREYVFAQLGKGMRQLRQRLSRPGGAEGDIILISVMFLAATAYVTGDMEGFEVHRKSLKQLVSLRGGLDKLGYGGGTKTVLLQWASSWKLSSGHSLWVDDRPTNEPVYPTIPLDKPTLALVNRLPSGLRGLASKGLICIELLHALSRMRIALSYKSARNIPYNQKIGQHDDYLSISSLQTLLDGNDKDRETSAMLEALLTLGLILFSSTAYNDMRATPVLFRGPKDALFKYLMNPDSPKFGDDAQNHCLQWIWAVSIDAWRDASRELMPQGHQMLNQFHRRYAWRWTTSADLAVMLQQFFWTDDLVTFHKQSFDVFKAANPQKIRPVSR